MHLPNFKDDIASGSWIPFKERYASIEHNRMAEFNRQTGGIESFTHKKVDKIIDGITLKHFVQSMCTYDSNSLFTGFLE